VPRSRAVTKSQPAGPPEPEPEREPLMDRDGIARLFTVTPGTIIRLARDGMPVAQGGGQGRQAKYLPSACVAWRLAQVESKYTGMEGLNPQVERAKRDRAQGRLAEQLHRRREGDLLEREDVRRTWSNVVVAIRARLLAMPQGLAERCAHAADPAAIEQILRDEVHSALRELADWKPLTETPSVPRAERRAPMKSTTGTDRAARTPRQGGSR
jgi:phage terminase Nu1 subunit (DNA packaging protein)